MTETASPSVASFAPVNFSFDDLKTKMNRFTIRFDKWTKNQRERVLKERNEFAKAIAESRGNTTYSFCVSLMQSLETQKDLNKQIEAHRAHQSEIAQGMHNSLPHPVQADCYRSYGILA